MNPTQTRLSYLREQIEKETISYSEIAELQELTEHIDKSDTLLLQWAGVPEFSEDKITKEKEDKLLKIATKVLKLAEVDDEIDSRITKAMYENA